MNPAIYVLFMASWGLVALWSASQGYTYAFAACWLLALAFGVISVLHAREEIA